MPASVLDASALMAFIHGEPGQEVVAAALLAGSAVSIVNWAEVLSKVAEHGGDPAVLETEYRARGFIDETLLIEDMTAADCLEVARLRPVTIRHGLSLADRVCLALAARLGLPVLTTDRVWAAADLVVEVQLIR